MTDRIDTCTTEYARFIDIKSRYCMTALYGALLLPVQNERYPITILRPSYLYPFIPLELSILSFLIIGRRNGSQNLLTYHKADVFQLLKDQRCVIKEEVVKNVISENKVPVTGFSVKFSFRSR